MSAPLPLQAFRREAEDVIRTAAAPDVQRWEWRHQFGTMVIEVRGDEVFVDQVKVQRLGAFSAPGG